MFENEFEWFAAYASSYWYENVYRFFEENESSISKIFQKIMTYRIDSDTKILWYIIQKRFLSCISETKIRRILINVHDKDEYWRKENILIKLRKLVYWFNQSENVIKYIADCVKCVRHESAFRFQFLHSIKNFHSFQFLKMNYIDFLTKISDDNVCIFHIIDYLTRFFFIYVCFFVTSKNTQRCLRILFTFYDFSKAFYTDREIHFDVEKIRAFFK